MKLLEMHNKTMNLVDDIYLRYDFIKDRTDALIYLLVAVKALNQMDIDRLTKFVEESKENESK